MPEQTTNPSARQPDGRQRKKKKKRANTGCLSGLLYFLFVIGISTLLAVAGWAAANDVLGLMKEEHEATVTITAEDNMGDVANKLQEAGLIKYPFLFKLYAGFSHADEKIDPGTYTLNSKWDYRAIVYGMRDIPQYETVRVVIPEGLTLKEILQLLADNKVCSLADLQDTVKNHDFEYSFLKDLPHTDNRLEGYLYPDTYDFYVNEKPVVALNKLLSNFDKKFTADLRGRADDMGLSYHEVITLASLIEKEAAGPEDADLISSVIHNRLNSSKYPFLQIDATIQYFLPERKERLTTADTEIDNPYNTYKYEGLPPGPIANPGVSSIRAALYPEETGYYFYAINKDGVHEFSKTKEQHDKIVAEARAAQNNP